MSMRLKKDCIILPMGAKKKISLVLRIRCEVLERKNTQILERGL